MPAVLGLVVWAAINYGETGAAQANISPVILTSNYTKAMDMMARVSIAAPICKRPVSLGYTSSVSTKSHNDRGVDVTITNQPDYGEVNGESSFPLRLNRGQVTPCVA